MRRLTITVTGLHVDTGTPYQPSYAGTGTITSQDMIAAEKRAATPCGRQFDAPARYDEALATLAQDRVMGLAAMKTTPVSTVSTGICHACVIFH